MTESTGEHSWQVALRSADADTLELSVYDVIGSSMFGDGALAKDMFAKLRAAPKASKISLRVNSVGGVVNEAKAMVNLLAEREANGVVVEGTVDGIAASAASYLLTAASKVSMPANAFMMLHGARGGVMGTASTMESAGQLLRRINDQMATAYSAASARRGKDKSKEDYLAEFAKGDLYLDAKEAIEWGLADEVISELKVAACLVDISELGTAPDALRAAPYVSHEVAIEPPAPVASTRSLDPEKAHTSVELLGAIATAQAANTESPATPAIEPIAATKENNPMTEPVVPPVQAAPEAVVVAVSGVKLLGVATEAEAHAKIKSIQNSELAILGATGKANMAEAMPVLLDWKQRADQHAGLSTQVAELTAEARVAKRDAALERMSREGSLPPARHDWARAQFSTAEAVESFCAGMPKGFFTAVTEQTNAAAAVTLSAEEQHICKLTGVTEQAFLEQKKLEINARSARVGA